MSYEKRYTNSNGDFQMWQIREDGTSRQVWNWEFREDYDPNAVIEIPYIAPPPPPDPPPPYVPTLEEMKAAKVAELKARHNEILAQGCNVAFQNAASELIQTRFDCEANNQADWITGLSFITTSVELGQFQATGVTSVRDFYNMNHIVNLTTYKSIVLQIGGFCYQHRETYWYYVNAAIAAQSSAEVAAVVWQSE